MYRQSVKMSLPAVFAIYRAETETFQLLQPEVNSENTEIRRLKNWARPDGASWREASEEDRETMLPWFHGQEWYVVPTPKAGTQEPTRFYRVTIHNKEYTWWFMNYKLVWSNSITYHHRHNEGRNAWFHSPRVYVVEFNTKLIYPRTNVSFYPRWSNTTVKMLHDERSKTWYEYNEYGALKPLTMDNIKPISSWQPLRIRTPTPTEDNEYDSAFEADEKRTFMQDMCEGKDYYESKDYVPNQSLCAKFVFSCMMLSIVAFYGLSISMLLGY